LWSANPVAVANTHFIDSISRAGDVNGDGFADLAVGAPGQDSSRSQRGRVYFIHGGDGALGLDRQLRQLQSTLSSRAM
jgi:hypothetical protein